MALAVAAVAVTATTVGALCLRGAWGAGGGGVVAGGGGWPHPGFPPLPIRLALPVLGGGGEGGGGGINPGALLAAARRAPPSVAAAALAAAHVAAMVGCVPASSALCVAAGALYGAAAGGALAWASKFVGCTAAYALGRLLTGGRTGRGARSWLAARAARLGVGGVADGAARWGWKEVLALR